MLAIFGHGIQKRVIFDNLHMLHDNLDDVLSRPDLFPDRQAIRNRILEILSVYLHRNHEPIDLHPDYHAPTEHAHGGMDQAPVPPSAQEVLGIEAHRPIEKGGREKTSQDHHGHK